MNILQPSRLTFWRFIFILFSAVLFLSVYQLLGRAQMLGVDFSASLSWRVLIAGLSLIGLLSLLFFAFTWSPARERLLRLVELPERAPRGMRWIGVLLFSLALIGFTGAFMIPFIGNFFGGIGWMRVLIFITFSLVGVWGIKLFRTETSWFSALITIILCQTSLHLLLLYWPRVTSYPFALGWSETSRFYYPSLFLSEKVYGQPYPWPILHPTLHLLLMPPYFVDAPLWFHRFWQVLLRYVLVAAIVPAFMKRLSIPGRAFRWLVGLWIFLFLFAGPIYFHLTIPVILVLLGFSDRNDRQTWLVVLLASLWCGWSRVNWYPMPGMIAAVLYLMEVPLAGKRLWQYLLKPALWFAGGTLTAFLSQRLYIALSGVTDDRLFYTSFISDLLWYRLWPNPSFALGILPGVIWASLPVALVIYLSLRAHRSDWHPIRLILIFAAIFVLMAGGIIVSLKIGGGANLHNMDAYFVLLLIFATYLAFARYRRENGELAQPANLHWLLIVFLLINTVWAYAQFGIGFGKYDAARTQSVLASLQDYVDRINAEDGETLLISQRHLISMQMLKNVELVHEYEREDLMEMAMANNEFYLAEFRKDMQAQRFALIVVDPLNYNILSRNKGFSEENNAWVKRVMRDILCNYREEVVFAEDNIALYVPQEEPRQCP